MIVFPIDQGGSGAGSGSYEAGLLTLSNGQARGVEDIARLSVCGDAGKKQAASQKLPDFLGTLRGALPAPGRLPMPARLAISTVRAGLGVIEEGFAPDGVDPSAVEIAFDDGMTIVARMSAGLIAMIRRDRDIALNAIARATRAAVAPVEQPQEADGSADALTSIFRYEKRNGRLRRVAEAGPTSKG